MFESFGFSERYILYRALLEAAKQNSGLGFHNRDQGHPAYVMGRSGQWDYQAWGDSPAESTLYRMMKELSESLRDCNDFRREDFVFDWADFCRLATDAYSAAQRDYA